MRMKLWVVNCLELFYLLTLSADEIVEHRRASKTNVFVRNFSVSMQPADIALLTDQQQKDQRVGMDR